MQGTPTRKPCSLHHEPRTSQLRADMPEPLKAQSFLPRAPRWPCQMQRPGGFAVPVGFRGHKDIRLPASSHFDWHVQASTVRETKHREDDKSQLQCKESGQKGLDDLLVPSYTEIRLTTNAAALEAWEVRNLISENQAFKSHDSPEPNAEHSDAFAPPASANKTVSPRDEPFSLRHFIGYTV